MGFRKRFGGKLFLFCQFLFVVILTFALGIVYGGFSVSEGTSWIFPVTFLHLGDYWEALGWWDSVFSEAVLFFQLMTAPLFAALFARLFRVKGRLGLAYIGSLVGGLVSILLFLCGILSSPNMAVFLAYFSILLAPLGTLLGYFPVRKSPSV